MKKIITLLLVLFIIFVPFKISAELTAIEKTIIRNYVIKFNAQLDEFKDECDTKIRELIVEVDECTDADELEQIKTEVLILEKKLEELEELVKEKHEQGD